MSSVENLVIEQLAEENYQLRLDVKELRADLVTTREVLSVALTHLHELTRRCKALTAQIARLLGEKVDEEWLTTLEPWYPPADSPPLPEGMVTADQIRWEAE